MKGIVNICYGLFFGAVLLYPQQIKYKTIEDTIINEEGMIFTGIPLKNQGEPIKKNSDVVYSMGDDFGISDTEKAYSVILAETDKETVGYFILDSLEREGINHEIHSVINGAWITAYTYDILHANSKYQIIKYEPYWGIETEYRRFDGNSWEDVISPTKLTITDNSFSIFSSDRNWRDFLFVAEEEKKGYFFVEIYTRGKNNPPYYDNSIFFARFTKPEKGGFYIEMDGEYLSLFENDSGEKPLMIFARTDDYEGITEKLRAIARGEKADLSDVTWPRHADGTCDYDAIGNMAASASKRLPEAAIPKPAPAMGKTAAVTENLRLRTDDTATAEVVTTLAAGTRVKVLASGRADTIDGIASNWVQVRVLGDAKDKDGSAIAAGTTGWLFGGYLTEAEESTYLEAAESEHPDTEEEEATNTPAAKQGASLPALPIAAGIVALAVLLGVVLLVAKRKKVGKE